MGPLLAIASRGRTESSRSLSVLSDTVLSPTRTWVVQIGRTYMLAGHCLSTFAIQGVHEASGKGGKLECSRHPG